MGHTNSNLKLRSYSVCYGFMEGPAHARRLKKLLAADGYQLATVSKAGIVIAHSAGCVLIPQSAKPRIVVYIGMPLNLVRPPKTWIHAGVTSLTKGHLRHQLSIRLKNTYAGVSQPRRTVQIMRDPKIAQPVIFPEAQTVFIANRHDPWPRGSELDALIEKEPWAFISLPGAHENLWEKPGRYVAIINHYAKLLA